MIINVKKTTMVKPAAITPRQNLWLSSLDLMNNGVHNPSVYFYRNSNNSSNFFDADVLKEALSKVLVPFYPVAGRFRRDDCGRLQINCNGEGVVFVEADTDSAVDEFGDFAPTPEFRRLVPFVDYSDGVSSYSFLLIQITYFKCGGVSVGIGFEHHIVDGPSSFHFVNSWSEIARGLDISIPPFLDRTLFLPRNPPKLISNHIECQPPPKTSLPYTKSQTGIKISMFKLTMDQLKRLKAKAKYGGDPINYSTYEILAGHIWKCVCRARTQLDDQVTKLYFPVNGRFSRFQPPVPSGYFGNVIFGALPSAISGDIKSKPMSFAVSRVHEALVQMNNDYLRSTIDYLGLQPDISALKRGPHTYLCPNLGITSWMWMGGHDADFGWGKPFFMGPGGIMFEGKSYVLPSGRDDGSLFVALALYPQHMKEFEKLFYEFDENKLVLERSSLRANL